MPTKRPRSSRSLWATWSSPGASSSRRTPWRWRIWTSRTAAVFVLLAGLAAGGPFRPALADSDTWKIPQGIVAQLDQFQELYNAPDEKNAAVISYIRENVDQLPPFFAMELSRRLYRADQDEALWWYIVGHIRGRYDALRCADKTAAAGLVILTRIAPEVAEIAQRDQTAFRRKGLEVLEWRGLYRSEASPWWICSHGEQAMQNVTDGRPAQDRVWLRPRRIWPTIRAKLTADFTTVFIELDPAAPGPPETSLD